MSLKHPRTLSPLSLVSSAVVLAVGMAGLGYHLGVRSSIDLSTTLRAPAPPARPALTTPAAATSSAEEETASAESGHATLPDAGQTPPAEVTPSPAPSTADAKSISEAVPSFHPAAARAPLPLAASAVQQPRWPLVMLDMDMQALGLSPGQQDMVARLREQFIEQVGGKDQNPSDPGYLKRWQQAAPAMDEILRAQIGWTAYNAFTVENARSRQAAAH